MKINDVTKIYGAYETQPVAGRPVKKPSAIDKTDKLMLSRDAIDFQAVMKGLKEAPDTRAGKVAEFTAKYEACEHIADARDLAEALLKSGVLKKTNT
jgi:hypothetical protein